jgi:hypothetical protein
MATVKHINFRITSDFISVSDTKVNVNSFEDIWGSGGIAALILNRGAR